MKFLAVKTNAMGSKLIRWALKTDASHFAVCFDEDNLGSGIVFHSHSQGAELVWLKKFLKKYDVVHAIEFTAPLTLPEEETIYRGLLTQYGEQGYDYRALAFWAYRGFLWRFFGQMLPSKNVWAVEGFALCTGLSQGIPWIDAWAKSNKIDLEMIAPTELIERLLATGHFKKVAFPTKIL